jgi:signal transduction histidine kinase/ActR/RegA family two-component response regulator
MDAAAALVPRKLEGDDLGRERWRARAIVFFVLIMVGIGAVIALGRLAMGQVQEAVLHLGVFGSLLLIPAVLQFTRRVGAAVDTLNALLLFGLVGQAALSGGPRSTLLLFLAVLPVVSVTFSGERRGAVWSVVAFATTGVFVAFDLGGVRFPTLFPAFVAPTDQAMHAAMLVALSAVVAVMFRYEVSHAEGQLQDTVDSLQRTNAELEAAREAAVASNEAKEAFLANVSHEMRTPLAAILGLAELMREEELGPVSQSYVHEISHSGQALLHIIDDLLDAVRARSHELSLEYSAFDLRDLCEDARAAVAGTAWRKRIALAMRLEAEAEGRYHGDPDRLRQILGNLLNNSVKFTEEGHVSLRVQRLSDGCLHFEVEDTGIGMPPEALSKVFERFEQADVSHARKFGGTGLGLAISRDLVERMGGRIGVRSEVGSGTVFWFEIPLSRLGGSSSQQMAWSGDVHVRMRSRATASELGSHLVALGASLVDEITPGTAAVFTDECFVDEFEEQASSLFVVIPMGRSSVELPRAAVRVMAPVRRSAVRELLAGVRRQPRPSDGSLTSPGQGRVLLVDDHAVNRMVTRRIIERLGWRVDEAPDGPTAVRLAADGAYHLVLMDCQMPGMDGYDATRGIHKVCGTGLAVVALTAGALAEDRERAIDAGMCDVLTKPVDVDRLVAVLERFGPPGSTRRPRKANA